MVNASRHVAFVVALLAIISASAFAAKVSDVTNTKHNLSTAPYTAGTDTRTVKATGESQICVFCHTPHKANAAAKAPLWNRALAGSTYTTYTSESMDATLAQPDGSSKLCLSCHDGTMALGSVGVLNGQENATIAMSGTDAGNMPNGAGTATGFTRDLGTDLTNDHPISFTYDSTLATADGELVDPATTTYIKNRTPGATHPDIPLENGKVQCIACHDPHIRDVDMAKNAKFLRLNRFQEVAPDGGTFSATDDTVCLACHDKDKAGWSGSAHANNAVATQTYTAAAATQRDFDAALPVWKAACLNCHDTHTVQGARRLLREGTDGATIADPDTGVLVKNGGNPAIEETCYQCHDNGAGAVLSSYTTVPNIKTDFGLAKHMPITSAEQAAGSEVHAIGSGSDASEGTQRGKDFVESPDLLGKSNLNNRHAECTDCHNPHRVIKNRLFNANPATPDAGGTHTHTYTTMHTNV
ncbi:MAG TPA: multiheme c-type cytochrome, partial [Gammaproteobacteria bacterium]